MPGVKPVVETFQFSGNFCNNALREGRDLRKSVHMMNKQLIVEEATTVLLRLGKQEDGRVQADGCQVGWRV